jgi:membrane protease YdiL (CAAX protease family)
MQFNWLTPFYLLTLYAIVYGIVAFLNRRTEELESKIRWTPLESISVTLLIYFAGQFIGSMSIYSVLLVFGWEQTKIIEWLTKKAFGIFFGGLVINGLSLGLLVLFLKRRSASLKTIGLNRKPKLLDIGYAGIMLIAYFAVYLIVITVVSKIIPSLNVNQEQQLGFEKVTNLQLPLVFISLVILPPLIEEIVMRGFLYSGLKNKLSYVPSVIITSGLFAIAHLQFGSEAPLLWVAAIDTFVLSLFLIYLKERTNSLWSPIFLHGLKNLIAFMSIFVFKIT